MRLLYIHGFASAYKPESDKVAALRQIGDVFGVDVQYHRGFAESLRKISNVVLEMNISGVIGTSMGGNMALHVGSEMKLPAVAINPSIRPSTTLKEGLHMNYVTRESFRMTADVIANFKNAPMAGNFGVVINLDDEVLDALEVRDYFDGQRTFVLETGGHRCTNFAEAVPFVKEILKDRS